MRAWLQIMCGRFRWISTRDSIGMDSSPQRKKTRKQYNTNKQTEKEHENKQQKNRCWEFLIHARQPKQKKKMHAVSPGAKFQLERFVWCMLQASDISQSISRCGIGNTIDLYFSGSTLFSYFGTQSLFIFLFATWRKSFPFLLLPVPHLHMQSSVASFVLYYTQRQDCVCVQR